MKATLYGGHPFTLGMKIYSMNGELVDTSDGFTLKEIEFKGQKVISLTRGGLGTQIDLFYANLEDRKEHQIKTLEFYKERIDRVIQHIKDGVFYDNPISVEEICYF